MYIIYYSICNNDIYHWKYNFTLNVNACKRIYKEYFLYSVLL